MKNIVAFLLLCGFCFADGEKERIAVMAARVRYGLSLRPEMPDAPPNVRLSNVKAIAKNPSQSQWVESGTNRTSVEHLIGTHGYTREQVQGMSQAELNRLHGYAHEHGGAPRATVITPLRGLFQPKAARNCPNGQCPWAR